MSLDAILAEYNKNNENAKSGGGKVDLKKYFNTILPDGVSEGIKTIRLLPGKDGTTPFQTIHVHTKKVNNQWKKFVCPKEEKGEDCPFCEAYDLIKAKGTEEQKKNVYQYRAKQAYVMRVIERGKEAEGVKFWRVNHNAKKGGHYDSIISLFKLYQADLSDPENGRDFAISIERNDKGVPSVTNIIAREPSPLHTDKNQASVWLNDSMTWEDVYRIKSYDFLKILVMGGEPVWDDKTKTFVDKNAKENESSGNDESYDNDLQNELTIGGEQGSTTTTPDPAPTQTTTPEPQTSAPTQSAPQVEDEEDDDDDDLPF